MREIKFRAKSVNGGEWVYGNFIHSKRFEGCSNEFRIHDQETGLETDIVYDTLGQFTGLRDKNGVEIYEGDILSKVSISKLGGSIQYFYEAFWSSSDQAFKAIQYVLDENNDGEYWRIKSKGFFDSLGMVYTYNHVIGNIHQNPKLIK